MAEQYRLNAEFARKKAQSATDDATSDRWRQLAEEWEALARAQERCEAPKPAE